MCSILLCLCIWLRSLAHLKEWFALSCFTMGNQNKYYTNGNGNQNKYLTDIRTQFSFIFIQIVYTIAVVCSALLCSCFWLRSLAHFKLGVLEKLLIALFRLVKQRSPYPYWSADMANIGKYRQNNNPPDICQNREGLFCRYLPIFVSDGQTDENRQNIGSNIGKYRLDRTGLTRCSYIQNLCC